MLRNRDCGQSKGDDRSGAHRELRARAAVGIVGTGIFIARVHPTVSVPRDRHRRRRMPTAASDTRRRAE